MDVRYRLALWLVAAGILSEVLYPQQVALLLSSIGDMSVENLGNFYALAALTFVSVFFLLRWRDVRQLFLEDSGFRTMPLVRLVGLALILLPLLLVPLLGAYEDAGSMAVLPVFLVFWGALLLISPSTLRMSIPYSVALMAATLLPSPLTALFGEPLVGVASFVTRLFLSATAVHYTYTPLPAPQIQFAGRGGAGLSLTITPFCSSISSISIFLLIVALMHIDLGKDRSLTIKMAVLGTVALVLLNGLRIAAIAWAGVIGGADLLAGVHGWIGYSIFVAFYAAAAFAYVSTGRPRSGLMSSPGG